MLSAVVWHWWIGVFLAVGAIVVLLATIAGYFAKVQSPKYPRR